METEMMWNLISAVLMVILTFREFVKEEPNYGFVKVLILINIWIELW